MIFRCTTSLSSRGGQRREGTGESAFLVRQLEEVEQFDGDDVADAGPEARQLRRQGVHPFGQFPRLLPGGGQLLAKPPQRHDRHRQRDEPNDHQHEPDGLHDGPR